MRINTRSSRVKQRRQANLRPRLGLVSSVGVPKMLTVSEVCEYLRVSRTTLYRLFKDRNIKAFRVSKRDWRVAVDELGAWVERESGETKVHREVIGR